MLHNIPPVIQVPGGGDAQATHFDPLKQLKAPEETFRKSSAVVQWHWIYQKNGQEFGELIET
jgi:hypothetical protein